MRQKIRLFVIILTLTALAVPLTAYAAVVGRFTLIKGQVDLLKGGKVPGIPAKVQDGVEPGDVIRTKTVSKAQLSMVDDSVITLAPESRLAIADYQYNPDRGERRAVVRLFRGLVHTVVNRIIKTEEPDFIMETHTATIGVRGTNFYTLVGPSFTATYLARGTLGVRSNLSTLPALLRLQSMQFTQILQGRQPSLPQALTPEILRMLEQLMDTGLSGSGFGYGSLPPERAANLNIPLCCRGARTRSSCSKRSPRCSSLSNKRCRRYHTAPVGPSQPDPAMRLRPPEITI